MQWDDVEEICGTLSSRQPPLDSRGMSDDEIVAIVIQLPGFEGDPLAYNAGHIEAIRGGLWWGPVRPRN
jgi:FeS assembly protein IscX